MKYFFSSFCDESFLSSVMNKFEVCVGFIKRVENSMKRNRVSSRRCSKMLSKGNEQRIKKHFRFLFLTFSTQRKFPGTVFFKFLKFLLRLFTFSWLTGENMKTLVLLERKNFINHLSFCFTTLFMQFIRDNLKITI